MSKKSKEQILEEVYQKGCEYEKKYCWCSQCCFLAVKEVLNLPDPDNAIFKASVGLGSGGGDLTEGACGAFSGGVLALGTLYGRDKLTTPGWGQIPNKNGQLAEERKLLNMIHDLSDMFKGKYGSYVCKEVQRSVYGRSFNFWDPKDVEAFERADGHTKCGQVVGTAARWVTEILLRER
jgi:Putative redox-active protein (C_GCAxxG_C_C)